MLGYNLGPDSMDRKIACLLMEDSTLTSAQIGEIVGLSSSAANERVRKMKKDGYIKKFVAILDSKFMEMELGAFISVWTECGNNDNFPECVKDNINILECHRITGSASYLLKVRCKNTKDLDDLTINFLKKQPGVTRTITQIIMSADKEKSFIID